ncbi:cyclin-dependent kinase 4 [Orussus abietinus]|uniref:cyclin-dependent kinase 4 n=1 Tax=Orussus abietinus TaxID=222816 RepID=UPI000625CD7C|nr:cyclin-dependent kinase 4 [Orussus abietinus]XP_012285486.1 cyclin-dependent kinase 4 [Orussus abietinus]
MAGRPGLSGSELEPDSASPPPKKRKQTLTKEGASSDSKEPEVESLEIIQPDKPDKPECSLETGSSRLHATTAIASETQCKQSVTIETEPRDKPEPIGEENIKTSLLPSAGTSTATEVMSLRICQNPSSGSSIQGIIAGGSESTAISLSGEVVEGESTSQVQSPLVGEHAHYQELSLIGNGAYGTVYKAKDLTSGQVIALKKVRVPLTEDGLPTSTLREIAALKQLDRFEHPHIVKLLDVCQGNYLQLPSGDERSERIDRGLTLWLVFEHVEQDLASYMSGYAQTGIPPQIVRQMSKEILLGVDFLHTQRIVHRDLKPQNLLVTKEGRIKIADFGLAKTYDFEMRLTSVVVTLWYRAPEVLLGCPYATPVDIWSVGCILGELNRLEPLFPGTSEGDQLDRIFQLIGTPSHREWPENVSLSWTTFPRRQPRRLRTILPDLDDNGVDLIKNILIFNPHNRLTAAQALRHPYFAEDDSR